MKKSLSLEISESEYCGLRQISAKQGISVRELLTAFIADATGSPQIGGSDDRALADQWVERRCFTHVWHCQGAEEMAERNLRFARIERWEGARQQRAEYERRVREARAKST